ncbi:T9SS type A sorting domain-containing protein [Chryseobacterium chendengshani]|uniref:T9SS type A sorting domain-containing protein n=1 Tax=unclassified Chryseobacterium TaxID=2593645 RepID=UPI001C6411BA|nr:MULTISPECIES: T9SS type A sorting domain-containing protein [unclassified Chryseobacterium]MBW7674734.1 T9SS type A sorting domain-containing protein [Chryseobacterium sp. LJ756]MBW8522474.1 T9SS type A sorting domain-containing protein [Chryseobacterium sp. LJ668]QYK16015.1 T9SS type A sorting domain-containing protein [Chryseobacterium sp. LJ668]
MKNTFILSLLFGLFFTSLINAQSKTWDFGNSATWPVSSGYSADTLYDNLAMIPGSSVTNLGAVEANSATFLDGYTAAKRFKLNGGSWDTGATSFVMPTKRYIYFAVTGACTIKVWFKSGGSGTRTLYVTNGTSIIGSLGSASSSDPLLLTANYAGGAGIIYVAGDQAMNIYKIEVSNNVGTTSLATLGLHDGVKKAQATVYTKGNSLFVSNLNNTNTEVKVYTATGNLVKTAKSSSEMNFDLESGFYLVHLKSATGEKSVKVALR